MMRGHSVSTVAQEPQELFRTCQEQLGGTARLGVSAVLFDPDGEKRAAIGFNEDERFPMASVVKVAIAMLVASEIAKGAVSLHEKIAIHSQDVSPGLITGPLDRFYFSPFETGHTHTVQQLMAFMIHDSDNTATDALLHRLGGTSAVTGFLIDELQIEGICIKRTMHELLTYYYALQPSDVSEYSHWKASQRFGSILTNVRRMIPTYACRRNREDYLIHSGEDTCTTRAITRLLKLLTRSPKYALVYSHMQRCATNNRRITEGLKEHRVFIKSFGHKTGSVGAIANDVGIIQFNNGYFAVLAVMTCHSAVRMAGRDEQIAAVTRTVVCQWKMEHLLEKA